LDKINQAIKQGLKGKNQSAVTALQKFIMLTERFVAAGQIPAVDGRQFITLAEAVIAELSR